MRCAQKGCGSYAFNLAHDGVDQGSLCDVHYWQSQANQLKALNAQQAAALEFITRQFTKTPSSLKDSEARCKAHAALAKNKGETA